RFRESSLRLRSILMELVRKVGKVVLEMLGGDAILTEIHLDFREARGDRVVRFDGPGFQESVVRRLQIPVLVLKNAGAHELADGTSVRGFCGFRRSRRGSAANGWSQRER